MLPLPRRIRRIPVPAHHVKVAVSITRHLPRALVLIQMAGKILISSARSVALHVGSCNRNNNQLLLVFRRLAKPSRRAR